jgi:hypothetical protein
MGVAYQRVLNPTSGEEDELGGVAESPTRCATGLPDP